ncbi:SDR family NAD(P)-dependent oxidoreductase [Aestuariibacter salexigens]|uniref:SDR family NAD(P)-dependent oxidoreductase n=1 Tax=Aestuariibacter salexigens TaxID=226010 RepID=UPI0009FE1594|nr:SDR family oxidoreductase [Aestuariibacter salexigens]
MRSINNKVCVVTGAASGMGRAYARYLSHQGARLALCDIDAAALEETKKMVPEAMTCVLDIGDRQSVYQFASDVRSQLGNASLVINNAGIEGSNRPFWQTPDQEFAQLMQVNFWGVVYGTRAFLPQLASHDWSALVNISSIFGLIGVPGNSDYCASKFAVRGFTESLMSEIAETDSNIQVHLVHPGGINTQIARKQTSQAFKQHFLKTKPDDFVETVMKSVMRNQKRIVSGNRALSTLLASKLFPLTWLVKLIGMEMRKFKQADDYQDGLLGFRNIDE